MLCRSLQTHQKKGGALKRTHCKRNLVPSRKQAAYKLPGTKSGLLGPKRVPRPVQDQHSSDRQYHRQYHGACSHEQRRGNEVGSSVCPSMENPDLVYQEASYPQILTHSRLTECGGRRAIQAGSDHSNRVNSHSRGLPSNMQQVAPASDRSFCNKVQQQTGSVCVTSTGPPGLDSQCTQSAMGGSGSICLPTGSHLGQSSGEVAGLPVQENHSDCPWWPGSGI